jgi:hypothetical protein
MKNVKLKALTLLGASLMLTISVVAQEQPKVKTSEDETKIKWEDDSKIKEKKDEIKYKPNDDDKVKVKKDEVKYKPNDDDKVKVKKDEIKVKSGDEKYKYKKDEIKYKTDDLKVKDEKGERKIKGVVEPMQPTLTERTHVTTGETNVTTKTHVEKMNDRTVIPAPAVVPQVPVAKAPAPAPKKTTTRKYAARKTTPKKSTGARTVVRTKVVRDTVFVPTPPETIVHTEREVVRDTVTVTRVDTVVKIQKENTYTGYAVPQGNFKKVKLKRDDNGEVWMKRKDSDGKTKTEKLQKIDKMEKD